MKAGRRKGHITAWTIMAAFLLSSCSVSKYLPENSYLLDKVDIETGSDTYTPAQARSSLLQRPNTRILGTFRWPMRIYCLSGKANNYINRTLRNIGEAPRIYDDNATQRSCSNIQQSLVNKGYLKADVTSETTIKGQRARVKYHIDPKEPYLIRSINYLIPDLDLLELVLSDTTNTLIQRGALFSTTDLNAERIRLAGLLHDHGYYTLQKDNISFLADTARNSTDVDLTLRIQRRFSKFTIDSIFYEGNENAFMRQKLFETHSLIRPGQLYNAQHVKNTYSSYSRFGAIKYTNISFDEKGDSLLNCHITVTPAKKYSAGVELDGTNTAGDLGVSTSLSFTNRNLFHGSELFTVKLRGAYEAITQLQDYAGNHYIEYGADASLTLPKLVVPFVSDRYQARSRGTTQFDLQWNSQDRPEFTRRVLSGSWSYVWNVRNQIQHRYDLFGVNLVSVPKKDQYFIDNYLNQYNSRNSILKFNYEDLFIARTGYTFYYNSHPNAINRKSFYTSYSVRAGIETAGNLLSAMTQLLGAEKDTLGQYRVGGIAFAQYVKGDFAWTSNINFNQHNALVFHLSTGVAYPYGNARMLPFEKRYYAGGANNVRGWSLRSLGPGSYYTRNGTIDYINQSGDVKLYASMEYRPHLFWKIDGALFVDAGNIWTIYDYDDQPGGQFMFDTFVRQIAVAYGLGMRLDLGFIIVRFDGGMKAINPAYDSGKLRYPIVYPNFKRDFAWHFAVGYPF